MTASRGPVGEDDLPCVHVVCIGEEAAEPTWVEPLEHGLEEEGVPWRVQFGAPDDGIATAYEAAVESPLKIGVSVSDSRIVVHHKQLPADSPVFDVTDVTAEDARTLGSNAARLAKGTPLKPVG